MNILFLGYWNADDPLTAATIIPHLRIIHKNGLASQLLFSSIQREPFSQSIKIEIERSGAEYIPLRSNNINNKIINKAFDFYFFPKAIKKIIFKNKIDLIIARGALAGALANIATRKNGVPYIVESYEPHADYMQNVGVWSKYDPRYIMQKYWETKINKNSKYLLTVSEKFKNKLIASGLPDNKIKVARCGVDQNKFIIKDNVYLRRQLSIPDSVPVVVYAGKFDGLYYKSETFLLFKALMAHFPNLYIVLLSDISTEFLNENIRKHGLAINRFRKNFVHHDQVSGYLNIADFAIAPYKKNNNTGYLSPVKLGEYWACGLPVILTAGVGDESEFIEEKNLGIALDMDRVQNKLYMQQKLKFLQYLIRNTDKKDIRQFALKYRSFDLIKDIYKEILKT